MPGYVLHQGATTLCLHGGQANPATPNPRVRVSGQPSVVQTTPYVVAGCPFVPLGGNGPCFSGQFMTAAVRVKSSGVPLLLQDSVAVCTPTGTGINILQTQIRVRAT